MIDQGILHSNKMPVEEKKIARGRPRSSLTLNPDAGFIVTLNLAIDLISTQRIDYAGQVCQSEDLVVDTRALSADELIEIARQQVALVCPTKLQSQLLHIGVAFQGMTEHSTGTLLWSPILSNRNIPLGGSLETAFGVPVSVSNDCSLISQALNSHHYQRLGDSFATVLFSNGVGLGLYLNGQPFSGTRSSALEIGHLKFEHDGALCRCGRYGCIEAYAADYGIERMARGTSIQDIPSGRVSRESMNQLVEEAQAGERAATQAFTIAGAAIGDGLKSLFTLLDPLPVALVGCSEASFNLMRGGIESMLRQHPRRDINPQASLHCFDDYEPLLTSGLTKNSLRQVDRLLSNPNQDPRKLREIQR